MRRQRLDIMEQCPRSTLDCRRSGRSFRLTGLVALRFEKPACRNLRAPLELLFRGCGRGIVAVGNLFAARGTDRVLELRDELFAEQRRRGLRCWAVFFRLAAICCLCHIFKSPRPLAKKMPANRRPHKATVVYFQSYWNVLDGTAIIMSSGTSVGGWASSASRRVRAGFSGVSLLLPLRRQHCHSKMRTGWLTWTRAVRASSGSALRSSIRRVLSDSG
jgi:hypothetical protein